MKFLINKETAMAKKIEGSRNRKIKTLTVQGVWKRLLVLKGSNYVL